MYYLNHAAHMCLHQHLNLNLKIAHMLTCLSVCRSISMNIGYIVIIKYSSSSSSLECAHTLAHTSVWEISTLITESVIGRHHRLRHCIIICNVANIHLCEGNVSIDYTVEGNQRLGHLLMDRGGAVCGVRAQCQVSLSLSQGCSGVKDVGGPSARWHLLLGQNP